MGTGTCDRQHNCQRSALHGTPPAPCSAGTSPPAQPPKDRPRCWSRGSCRGGGQHCAWRYPHCKSFQAPQSRAPPTPRDVARVEQQGQGAALTWGSLPLKAHCRFFSSSAVHCSCVGRGDRWLLGTPQGPAVVPTCGEAVTVPCHGPGSPAPAPVSGRRAPLPPGCQLAEGCEHPPRQGPWGRLARCGAGLLPGLGGLHRC